jgi:hypothetical protein
MATADQILDMGQKLREISFKNFEAGDKVLMLLEGVKITLDNTRDENRRTLEERDSRISEQAAELVDRLKQLQSLEARSAVREAEFARQTNAYAELAGQYASTSAYLEEVKATVVLTAAQLQLVETAAAEAARSFSTTIATKDALVAEETKAKLDALDQVAKLGSDVASLLETINLERTAREEMIKTHESDNDKILAMVEELFKAETEEDRDIREKAEGKGGYE